MYSLKRRCYRNNYGARSVRRVHNRLSNRQFAKASASRRLSYDVPKPIYARRSIEDVHNGANFNLANQTDHTSYVNFPCLGIEGNGGRSFDHIKLCDIKISGTINACLGTGDHPMGTSSSFTGIFLITLLLDKKPFVPEGVNTLPTFKELFGDYECVYASPRLKDNVRHRYRMLTYRKLYISTQENVIQKPFNFRKKISSAKWPVWASFKDADMSSSLGNYKNMTKNSILVNCVWVSLCNSKCEVYSQYVMNYVG
ncbi:nuclear shuttle protein [Deinbollia mosaic virus]|uniref:Nuclear shuttle protein n=1 Tax=Deinbollia mosaic virus TaxID=1812308 RepID=A0A142C6K4_9GEMI|nr:nuclear shuttle protein [Deinbollia mosaic virus]AMP46455.1 nuclear shuttle protein [Deinbollia mosaic virus]